MAEYTVWISYNKHTYRKIGCGNNLESCILIARSFLHNAKPNDKAKVTDISGKTVWKS